MRRVSRRAFVVVLDACGVGALPDAAEYAGDEGSNTLGAPRRGRRRPATCRCSGAWGSARSSRSRACRRPRSPVVHGRLHPLGPGQGVDHRPLGAHGRRADGAAADLPRRLPARRRGDARASDRAALLRQPPGERDRGHRASGASTTCSTGEVILYTSADSVLQLAAHHDVLSEPDLLAACAAAREVMTGEHAVGRVIARPFAGEPGAFARTDGRKDFAVAPPGRSYLDELQSAGVPVHAVGKVRDLFAGVGIDEYHPGATNERGIAAIGELLRELDAGLVFANLVETDQVYGHRHDVEGFHRALREIDAAVGEWLGAAARRRPARPHRRPRRRPARAAHRPHARARAAAGHLRRPGRPPPRRPAGRRRGVDAAVAGGREAASCRARRSSERRGARTLSAVPELPEVETIRRQLAPLVEGRVLDAPARSPTRAGACRWRPRRSSTPSQGRRVERLGRRGKYLVWELEDDVFLLMHLRMTGHAALRPAAGHAVRARALRPRRRPRAALLRPAALRDRRAGARDARRATPSSPPAWGSSRSTASSPARRCARMARGRRAPVKAFLLDQRRIAGVGQHLRRRGALPRAHPPAAPGRHASRARSATRSRDAVREALHGRPRRRRRDDRRLPPRRRRQGRLPGRVPRPPRRGEPCPRVRHARSSSSWPAGRGTYACERCQPRPRRRRARRPAR